MIGPARGCPGDFPVDDPYHRRGDTRHVHVRRDDAAAHQSGRERHDEVTDLLASRDCIRARHQDQQRRHDLAVDHAVDVGMDLGDARAPRRLGIDLGHQPAILDRRVHREEPVEPGADGGTVAGVARLPQSGFIEELRQILGDERGDHLFLAGEVAIDLADLDPRRGGELRDTGGVEAPLGE